MSPSPDRKARLAPGDAVRLLCATYEAHLALGHERIEAASCVAVRSDASDRIFDANHLQGIRLEGPDEVDAALAHLERALGDRTYRHVLTNPTTDPAVTARLALEGYRPTATLQLLLEGELAGPAPREADIYRVESDDDWSALHGLIRENHEESNAKAKGHVMTPEVTREMFGTKRAKAPDLQFFLARVAGEPVAFFSAWPGVGGVGIVEDLFTRPTHRRQGIARALIHCAVADARARGAGPVLIGAELGDWPRHAYAALGFRPTCLTWSWLLSK